MFVFIGDGSRRPALEAAARARGLDNVRFLPFQPRDQMRWTYATSDVCLVSLKPGLAGYIVPSKVYPILAAGRPYIAAVEPQSEVAAVTERHRCGVLVTAGDAAGLAAAITRLARDPRERDAMGGRARVAAELFSRERQVAAHAHVLEEVAGPLMKRAFDILVVRRRAARARAGRAADCDRHQARRRRAGVLHAGARRAAVPRVHGVSSSARWSSTPNA